MPQKKSFIDIDPSILTHFSLELGGQTGLLVNHELCSVYVTEEVTQWKKIVNIIQSSNYDLDNHVGKKRAYILNNCDVTNDRLKSACKEHSITITNDIDRADILLTHENIGRKYSNGDPIRSGEIAFKLWNYDTTSSTGQSSKLADSIDELGVQGISTIVDDTLNQALHHNFHYGEVLLEGWAISGKGLRMAHLIETKVLETLNVDDILSASGTKTTLDNSLLETLKSLLQSHDNDNKEIVKKLIPTVNVTINKHLLWNLFQECGWEISQLERRDKDIKYWMNKANGVANFEHSSAEEMILTLEENNTLEKEEFQYFEKICRDDIEISNRDLYVFKVKLKKEYRHYYE